jgi:hypothetical protein
VIKEPGRGSAHRGQYRRIVVAFDEETFAEVRELALADGQSMAAKIRELIEWGMMRGDD